MAQGMNYMWLSLCRSERKKPEAALPQSHNQIIALDSSFVYQAETKGQLPSKNSHKAESSDHLRCLIIKSKPYPDSWKIYIDNN